MGNRIRARRDFQALENRRKHAGRLFAAGGIQAAVARTLAVSRQTVSRWYRQWRRGGLTSLRGTGRAGRKPRLKPRQRQRIDRALRQGARSHGYGTDLWTLPRVATLIERLTGVHYHPGHVWKLLRAMNWTLQRPAKRARERNEEAVRRWVSRKWPAVKKCPASEGLDPLPGREWHLAGPSVRRTWAPRGETPVLIHAFNWKKVSVCVALAYQWDGQRCRLFSQTRPGSYDTESLIAFLKDLRRHFSRNKIILVWDGLPAHKSRIMKDFLRSQTHWLKAERLPGYAPDLNPVETLWGNIKGQELANRCVEELAEAETALRRGMARVRRSGDLPFAFLKHAGLSLLILLSLY